jgi:23S rRNA (cytosine1962-C5)-methyltransferase
MIDVCDAQGAFLARGTLNRRSQIVVRLLTWEADEPIDADFWRRRLEQAIASRRTLAADPTTNAYRLVNAESDGLPGVVVDRYDGFLGVQLLTLGAEHVKNLLAELLAELLAPEGIVERSDVDVREKEGLRPASGRLWGAEPPPLVEVQESGLRFLVDLKGGHKTGFYLDQRENRRTFRAALAAMPRAEVLNAFAYTGAFGAYAAAADAGRITQIESSAEALDLARQHLALNGFADRDAAFVVGDVFAELRRLRAEGRRFDAIVLDPPKFVHSAGQLPRATRGYKDINWLAFQLLRPEGLLFTFSCSGLVTPDLFQKIVFSAALDAGRDAQIVAKLSQGPDHPILLSFPESEYLKGLTCRVF